MMSSQDLRTLLGRRIQFYRKLRQLSQATLAEKVDISITSLSQIELGNRYPTADTLCRITNSLGVEVCELFQESEMPAVNRQLLTRLKNDVLSSVLNSAVNSVQKSVHKSVEAVFTKYDEENRPPSG